MKSKPIFIAFNQNRFNFSPWNLNPGNSRIQLPLGETNCYTMKKIVIQKVFLENLHNFLWKFCSLVLYTIFIKSDTYFQGNGIFSFPKCEKNTTHYTREFQNFGLIVDFGGQALLVPFKHPFTIMTKGQGDTEHNTLQIKVIFALPTTWYYN